VVAVAATDAADRRAAFSNYGSSWVDLAAPGTSILTTVPSATGTATYSYLDGTSLSAPIVTGIAALIWPWVAVEGGATNEKVAARLSQTADRIAGTGFYWRYGRVNACLAVTASPSRCAPTPPPAPPPSPPT